MTEIRKRKTRQFLGKTFTLRPEASSKTSHVYQCGPMRLEIRPRADGSVSVGLQLAVWIGASTFVRFHFAISRDSFTIDFIGRR